MDAVAEVFPRHEAGDDIAVDLRRGGIAVEIERGGAQARAGNHREDAFGAVVAAVVDLEIDAAIFEIGGAHEVVDAVHLGAAAGGHRGPGGWRERVARRHQVRRGAATDERGQEWKLARLREGTQEREGRPVETDHQNTSGQAVTPRNLAIIKNAAIPEALTETPAARQPPNSDEPVKTVCRERIPAAPVEDNPALAHGPPARG